MRRLLLLLELPFLVLAWPVVRLVRLVRDAVRRRRWPRTVDAAVSRVISQRPDVVARAGAFTSPEAFAEAELHGLGAFLRLELGLWQGNDALLGELGTRDGDRASFALLLAVHRAATARRP